MMPSSGAEEDFRATSRPSWVSVGLPDLAHAAFAKEGGDVEVPEAGARGESHGLLVPRIGSFYAQVVNGSTVPLFRSLAPLAGAQYVQARSPPTVPRGVRSDATPTIRQRKGGTAM